MSAMFAICKKRDALGDFLVVAVNSDSSVRGLKGPDRPGSDRKMTGRKFWRRLACVNAVTIFAEPDPMELIRVAATRCPRQGRRLAGRKDLGLGHRSCPRRTSEVIALSRRSKHEYVHRENSQNNIEATLPTIRTRFTEMMKIDLPLIAAPMFLVSNEDIVVESSEAGAIGTFPALNYRPIDKYIEALKAIRQRTKRPIGVNIITNKSNSRQHLDLKHALDAGVELFITSLGSPKQVIEDAHKNGAKVICDVINLEYALKVQDLGADGVIAVASGAGGHAGPTSPFALIPWLKSELDIPIVAAGAISTGASMAAALFSWAPRRFRSVPASSPSREAKVVDAYKDAILKATPDDIVMTTRVSGTPAAVIKTPYIEKSGLELHWALEILKKYKLTKKWATLLIHYMGMKSLENAANKPTWKTVWSAGQSVGMIDEILSCREIIDKMVTEYVEALKATPQKR